MTVLVIGAGYIGAALIAACLRAGDRVVALENGFATDLSAVAGLGALGDFTLVRGDVRDREAVDAAFRSADEVTSVYLDRKSTRLNSSHEWISRMPSSA